MARALVHCLKSSEAIVRRSAADMPFNGALSPLVQVMVDGSMPPPGIAPRPSELEITMIRAFIDNPLLWPELPPVE